MDKFTVDLDQVLNDFEYSELTDQYNSVRQPADAPSTLNHNVTKHSINNVFHSLNEYLNTSIDKANINSIENNLREENVLKKVENVDLEGPTTKSLPVEDCADNKFCEETNDSCDLDAKVTDNEEYKNNEGDLDEKFNVVITENINIDDEVQNSVTFDKENTSIPQTQVEQEVEPASIKEEEKEDNTHETTIKQNIKDDKEDILVQIETISDEVDFKIEENLTPNIEPLKSSLVLTQNDKVAIEEELINEKIMNPIGFKEITVDDDEIHELLAELENDVDLINEECLGNDINVKNDEKNDIKDNGDSCQPEEEKQSEPISVVITEKAATSEISDSEIMTTNEAEAILEESTKLEESPVEIIEETNQKVDTNVEESLEERTVDETLEEEKIVIQKSECLQEMVVEKDNKPKKIMEGMCAKGKEESNKKTEDTESDNVNIANQEAISRPQHLPLKENENEVQREINLIGEPGSTPYNNVYISEEITKQEQHDNESISSISSNTFSDTGSTASTASTEEIRDDNDVINTNVVEEQNQPTENLEKGTRELSDDGDNARNVAEEISDSTEMGIEQSARSSGDGAAAVSTSGERQWLGKEAPLWIPDSDTTSCLHCDMKFTVLKRRHHCRACGLVLCSKCCHLRFKLDYLDAEARVCNKCHDILNKDTNSSSSSEISSPDHGNSPLRRPNPNNPLEYCSTISPLQQISGTSQTPLPAVMVPVGVLKRKGNNKSKSNKSVMFCDGIRPGSDLTNLDNDFNYNNTKTKKLEKTTTTASAGKINRNLPLIDSDTNSFIPKNENSLPPLVTITKTDISYTDCQNNPTTVEQLKQNQLTFAILLSLYVHVKIINMSCCINKTAWCFSTEGLINVGQDEIIIMLEYIDEEAFVPKDVFYHIKNVYADAVKGTSIKELGVSLHNSSNFLDSKNHAGFVYIRPTFQCLDNVIKPKEPFLIGILIHRWETPWAKLFPLRLILRLGAEYRYYPSPVISTRNRDSVFVEIGHTIINLLADFRNFSYTLPQISGLTIHMEDKNTTVTIPINRYDEVIKSMNNSSDHILAFGGSFSQDADSHLVCIQDTQSNENCYSTHAINIQNKPRKVTGASFIVFNGALKSSSGLTAKSNIVEDGLMIQVLPEHMQQIRDNLRAMKNHTISCGCVNAVTDETVNIVWGENDTNFNIGVTSSIDGMSLSGIPSIRVHNGKNHYGANGNRIIRWTEVFIIQNGEENSKNQDPVDVSKISENIAKATCDALLNYLDLLVTNNFQKIGIRTTLHVDSVSYCAGSNNTKLPPIYMKSLDNELIPVLHRITSSNLGENAIILELIFRILNV